MTGLDSINLIVDLNNAVFTDAVPYSYTIGSGFGDQSGLSITGDSRFTFINGVVTPGSSSITGDVDGRVFLNFTPTPEPLGLVVVGLLGIGIWRRRR